MRIRVSKSVSLFIIVINLLLFFLSWKFFIAVDEKSGKTSLEESLIFKSTIKPRDFRIQESNKYLRKSLTIVFRDFFHYDNDLKNCIDHLAVLIPGIKILIICDELPYPDIFLMSTLNQTTSGSSLIHNENVQFFHLGMDFLKTPSERNPLNYIITKYTLFLPDGFRLSNGRQLFIRLIKSLGHNTKNKIHRRILAIPFASNNKFINYCLEINFDFPNWNLNYETKNTTKKCDMVKSLS